MKTINKKQLFDMDKQAMDKTNLPYKGHRTAVAYGGRTVRTICCRWEKISYLGVTVKRLERHIRDLIDPRLNDANHVTVTSGAIKTLLV